MKFHSISLLLAVLVVTSDALQLPVRKTKRSSLPSLRKRASGNFSVTTSDVDDLIYIANITVGGTEYPIQLDTGSSDLWIKGPSSPLPNSKQTSISSNITYGIGWANGTVSYADVQFVGVNVSQQAYLDASQADNPALSYGADGIAGLGFSSLSTIDSLLNNSGASTGGSLLYNMFIQDKSVPNFIAFSLQRNSDSDSSDQVVGTLSIGEYDSTYASVANQTAISTFPTVSPSRWSVLLEAYMIGSDTLTPDTQVNGAPSNRAVVVLDTGTSWSYAPTEVCEVIYSGVSGASYDSSLGQYVLPCDAEIDMALQFGDVAFPLHPLDINIQSQGDSSQCVGTFVPSSFAGDNFDWLLGDNVLRSMYAVYDFGSFNSNNEMINPFVRLLPLVNADEASEDFVKARGGTANTNIIYHLSNSTPAAADETSVDLSTEVAETLAKIGTYFPAILAVVALNALVLLALAIIGVIFLVRRNKKTKRARILDARTRTPMGRLSPMPMNARDSTATAEPHNYEPISMALTEDTMFVPPSPAFKMFNGSAKGKSFDRPTSLATLPSQRTFHPEAGTEDALFGPPSPGFREFSDSRPKSMGMSSNNPYQPFVAAGGLEQGTVESPTSLTPPRSPAHSVHSFRQRQESTSSTLAGPSSLKGVPMDEPFSPPRPRFQYEARNIDRPISVGGTPPPMPVPQLQHEVHPLEQDITSNPPNPSFLRPEGQGSPGDRPMSVA